MFDRLFRRPADQKPAEFGRRVVSPVGGQQLTPLAAKILDHYRKTTQPYGAEFQVAAKAFTEDLLKTVDPAELVVNLVISLPAITVEPLAEGARNPNVQNGYHSIICHALDRLKAMPAEDWRISEQQIWAALKSYERVILANPHSGMQSRVFLSGLMKRAARGAPGLRTALISFINSALQGQHLGATQFRNLVEENLPALGIARKEIPILIRWAGMGRAIQLRREQLIAAAGPLLGPALDHLLDNGAELYRGRSEYGEALKKLFDADALAKGEAFSHLLTLIVTPSGYDNLQAMARYQGYFSYEIEPPARPLPPLDMLAIELAKGKMDLADPDRDHAKLIFLLTAKEHNRKDNSRLILKQLLKTVEAHPEGATSQALKKLIEHPSYTVWAADFRETLRGGAPHAGSDSEKPAGLPPVAPNFSSGGFADLRNLEEHFGNLLEPRLHDPAHSDYPVKLNETAGRAGIGREELDEISVPTHGLDPAGTRSFAFAQGRAVMRATGAGATLEWFNAAGKPMKSPSKAMKDEKELFKEVQSAFKELNADLAIQPQRLQQFYLQARSWPHDIWRARYLDHPLMRALVLKLVWWIDRADEQSVAAMPDEAGDSFLDVAGNAVVLDGARLRLWHPMDGDVAAVEAWRDRLDLLRVTQPFAQVWREVYALTDDERANGAYTDRWAAHILKQDEAMTLAWLNGWRVTHRMAVDAPNDEPWHILIPAHNLVADYWVQGAGGDNAQIAGSAAYAYVSTDRVQFHRIAEDAADSAAGPQRSAPVPLTEIPPVVFSEIMRHGDLLTAVASIAADPLWLDAGGDADHPSQWDQYWRQTNTAALVESGQRRRAMLERIVPRLKIASKLKLDDRYLVVKGARHEYEIHLGSGAVSRGGRHICIVPKPSLETGKIWLPFEGDRTLSIIISKALLLAADNKITDPVILRQL